jgi:BRCA1-associated protein
VHLYTRRYDLAGGGAGGGGSEPLHRSSSMRTSDNIGETRVETPADASVDGGLEQQQQPAQPSDQQHYNLFVLAVPSYLSPADFCSFIGPELMVTVLHMRVVRDDDPSRYMVLLQMRDHNAAEELRQMKNGAQFSSLMATGAVSSGASEEAETCYVLYIEQLIWEHDDGDDGSSRDRGGARLTCDGEVAISLAMASVNTGGSGGGGSGSGRVSPVGSMGQSKVMSPPPPPGHVEVPRCPVCLERLDPHASGILTVLCNHSFHSECLTKWGDSTCPVCRYVHSHSAGRSTDALAAHIVTLSPHYLLVHLQQESVQCQQLPQTSACVGNGFLIYLAHVSRDM